MDNNPICLNDVLGLKAGGGALNGVDNKDIQYGGSGNTATTTDGKEKEVPITRVETIVIKIIPKPSWISRTWTQVKNVVIKAAKVVGDIAGAAVGGVGMGVADNLSFGANSLKSPINESWFKANATRRVVYNATRIATNAVGVVIGAVGEAGGTVLSATGVGAIVGVPAIAISTTLVVSSSTALAINIAKMKDEMSGDQNDNVGGNTDGVGGTEGAGSEKNYSDKTYKSFEKQLNKDGMKSIEKSRAKLQRRLNEHKTKLEEYKKAGGNTSSVEREIRTFEGQLDAIKDLLKTQ